MRLFYFISCFGQYFLLLAISIYELKIAFITTDEYKYMFTLRIQIWVIILTHGFVEKDFVK